MWPARKIGRANDSIVCTFWSISAGLSLVPERYGPAIKNHHRPRFRQLVSFQLNRRSSKASKSSSTTDRRSAHRRTAKRVTIRWIRESLLFQLQFSFVVFHELLNVSGSSEEAIPLLVVQSDGKAAQTVDTDAAFFADFEDKVATAFLGFDFLFQLGQFRFKFFVAWFRHEILVPNEYSPDFYAISIVTCPPLLCGG